MFKKRHYPLLTSTLNRILKILFALLSLTAIIYYLEQQTIPSYLIACTVFIIAGSSVEFWWPVLAFGIAVWWYCNTPQLTALIIAIVALLLLRLINGNDWALAALPVLFLSTAVNIPMRRYQWLFYYFYPVHLGLL